jgi:hypothetical protein
MKKAFAGCAKAFKFFQSTYQSVICFQGIGYFRGKTRLSTGFQDIDWVFPDLMDCWFFVTDIELLRNWFFRILFFGTTIYDASG